MRILVLVLLGFWGMTAKAQDSLPLELMVPVGHSSFVNSVDVSPDGQYIISSSSGVSDNSIRVWNLANGREIRSIKGQPYGGISPDSKYLITGSASGEVLIWDFESGILMRSFSAGQFQVGALAFSPNGKEIVTAVLGAVKVWDFETGKELRSIPSTTEFEQISKLQFSDDGAFLFSGSMNMTVRVWNYLSGEELFVESGDSKGGISPDGKLVAAPSVDKKSVNVWEVSTGKLLHNLTGHAYAVMACTFGGDGSFVTGGFTEFVSWDLKTGEKIRQSENIANGMHGIALSKDGKHCVTGDTYGEIKVWDYATARALRTLKGYSKSVLTMAASSDNQLIATAGDNNEIRLWDLRKGVEFELLKGHQAAVSALAISSDGRFLASGSMDGNLILWNLSNGSKTKEIRVSEQASGPFLFAHLRINPNGQMIAAASQSGFVLVIDSQTGEIVHELSDHSSAVLGLAISPNGKYLAACSLGMDGFLGMWDLESGSFLGRFKDEAELYPQFHQTIIFSRDGQHLVTGTAAGQMQMWNVENKQLIENIQAHNSTIKSLALSSDGNQLAVASEEGGLKFWEFQSGRGAVELDTSARCRELIWGANSAFLLAANEDNSVSFWDLKEQKKAADFISVGESDWMIVVSSEGLDYYQSSKHAAGKMGYTKGLKSYSFEQFDLQFNRPDIVQERMQFASSDLIASYRKAYQKRVDKMGFAESAFVGKLNVPELHILNVEALPISTSEKSVQINLKATASSEKLDRINVWINDVPIYGFAGISVKDKDKSILELPIELDLSEGNNVLQFSVLNSSGIESLKESIAIECTAGFPKPDLYVLTFGVSEYQDSNYNLKFASKDAGDVGVFFNDSEIYANVHRKVFLDANVTKGQLKEAAAFLNQSKLGDQVLVYLSGHGVLDEDLDFYFATYDTDFSNPKENGILYEDIEALLDGIAAREKLLLMDACHSGEVDKESMAFADGGNLPEGVKGQAIFGSNESEADSFELMKELFSDLRRGTGAHVISSASGAEFSYEGNGFDNGLFTYAFLYGLKSGDADVRTGNKDGKITISEIRDYVSEAVNAMSKGKQSPTARRENLQFDFRIY